MSDEMERDSEESVPEGREGGRARLDGVEARGEAERGDGGEPSAVGNPYLYTGREFDPESGLFFYRARTYDPGAGRFLQRDPIGPAGGTNLYEYVASAPAGLSGALGLDPYGPADRDDSLDGEGGPAPYEPGETSHEAAVDRMHAEQMRKEREAAEAEAAAAKKDKDRQAAIDEAMRFLRLYGPHWFRPWLNHQWCHVRPERPSDNWPSGDDGGFNPRTGETIIGNGTTDRVVGAKRKGRRPRWKSFRELLVTLLHEALHAWLRPHSVGPTRDLRHPAVPRIRLGFGEVEWEKWVQDRVDEIMFIIEMRHGDDLPWDPDTKDMRRRR